MITELMDMFMEFICDNYCNCERCNADNTPCYLEEDLKEIIRKEFNEYLK